MKIQQATIYGFGKWVDYSIDFSEHPLLCVYGENESGKSTLQNFILFMLFGLPPRKRTFYRPKTSDKMGGRLTIFDSDIGKYTIERFDGVRNGAAKCYLPDGREFDEDWLNEQLKGMTEQVYQSIFSFSALDLNDFQDMKDEDLGEVLLGIGLTGSNNIHTIEKRLDNKIGELFKPYGKNPAINQQFESLDALFVELTNYKNNEATYSEKQAQLSTLMDEIEQLQAQLQQEKEARLIIEKQQNGLPIINDYHNFTKQLLSYPKEIHFPENGLDRLNVLKEMLLPLKSELSILQGNQEKSHIKHKELQDKRIEENIYEEVQIINQNQKHYIQNKDELKQINQAIEKHQMHIDRELQESSIGLTSGELAYTILPFHIEKMWNEIKSNAEKLTLETEQLQQEQNALQEQSSLLTNQYQEIEAVLLTEERINDLHLQIDNHKEYKYIKGLEIESVEKQGNWKKAKIEKEKNIRVILIGSLILSLLVGGIAKAFDISLLFNVMVIIFIIGLAQWILGKKSIIETDKLFLGDNTTRTATKDVTDMEKQTAEKLLRDNDENKSILASINEQLKSIDIQHIQWKERKKIFERQEAKLNNQIAEQYNNFPFLKSIEVPYWPEFFHTIKQLVRVQHEIQAYEKQSEQLQEKQGQYEVTVRDLLIKLHSDSINVPIDQQLELLENIQEEQQNLKYQLINSTKLMTENTEQQDEVGQKILTYEQEVRILFDIAQVDTEDGFYKKEKLQQEKIILEEGIKKTTDQLSIIFSRLTWKEQIENILDQNKLEVSHQQSNILIEEIEEIIDNKRQELAAVNADLTNMESSESYSNTIHRFTMEQEQLAKLANEWAILKTAKEMLVETKRNYRDKYLTQIIDKTSDYFIQITGNMYRNVFAPTEEKGFQVEAHDEVRYNVNELSQGTIDQLYISLRLAISEIMSKAYRLPFIIDDAFVHFDASRTKRVMEILTDISHNQQIIIFTCKQEVVASLTTSQVHTLGRSERFN